MGYQHRVTKAHLEENLEEFFRKRVRLLGGYAFKFVPLVAGMPDRIVFFPDGEMRLVELKREGEKPSPIQVVWHGRFKAMGHPVAVLDTEEKVLEWLALIVDARGPQNKNPGRKPRQVH